MVPGFNWWNEQKRKYFLICGKACSRTMGMRIQCLHNPSASHHGPPNSLSHLLSSNIGVIDLEMHFKHQSPGPTS